MNQSAARSARWLAALLLAGTSISAGAQHNSNRTHQVGQVNINHTWQCGEVNDNATEQAGRININRTVQSCPGSRGPARAGGADADRSAAAARQQSAAALRAKAAQRGWR